MRRITLPIPAMLVVILASMALGAWAGWAGARGAARDELMTAALSAATMASACEQVGPALALKVLDEAGEEKTKLFLEMTLSHDLETALAIAQEHEDAFRDPHARVMLPITLPALLEVSAACEEVGLGEEAQTARRLHSIVTERAEPWHP